MRSYPPGLKFVSAIVAVVFLLQEAAGAAPAAWSELRRDPSSFSMPQDIGLVKGARQGSGSELILNIKDIHDNYSAQESIAGILENLATQYDATLIGMEGGFGGMDMSLLGAFPDAQAVREAGSQLMREGRLSAVEFVAAARSGQVELYGVDDEDLYRQNLDAFRDALDKKKERLAQLERIEAAIARLVESVYSEDLKDLNRNGLLRLGNGTRFSDRWQTMRALAEKTGVSQDGLPNLEKLADCLRIEKSLDFRQINDERQALMDELARELPQDRLEKLLLEGVHYRMGRVSQGAFSTYLLDEARRAKMDLSGYSSLEAYADYMVRYESVDIEFVRDEATDLEERIREKLYRNEDERTLHRLEAEVASLRDLFDVKLSSAGLRILRGLDLTSEADRFVSDLNRLERSFGTETPGSEILDLFGEVPTAMKFYELAEQRNQALLNNMIRRMRETGRTVGCLVTGGFHSRGIIELMNDGQVPYVVVMPRFNRSASRPYVKILTSATGSYRDFAESAAAREAREDAVAYLFGQSLSRFVGARADLKGVALEAAVAGEVERLKRQYLLNLESKRGPMPQSEKRPDRLNQAPVKPIEPMIPGTQKVASQDEAREPIQLARAEHLAAMSLLGGGAAPNIGGLKFRVLAGVNGSPTRYEVSFEGGRRVTFEVDADGKILNVTHDQAASEPIAPAPTAQTDGDGAIHDVIRSIQGRSPGIGAQELADQAARELRRKGLNIQPAALERALRDSGALAPAAAPVSQESSSDSVTQTTGSSVSQEAVEPAASETKEDAKGVTVSGTETLQRMGQSDLSESYRTAEAPGTERDVLEVEEMTRNTAAGIGVVAQAGLRLGKYLAGKLMHKVRSNAFVRAYNRLFDRYQQQDPDMSASNISKKMFDGLGITSRHNGTARQNFLEDLESFASEATSSASEKQALIDLTIGIVEGGDYNALNIRQKQLFLQFMLTRARIYPYKSGYSTAADVTAFNVAARKAYFGDHVVDPTIHLEIRPDYDAHGGATTSHETGETTIILNADSIDSFAQALNVFAHEIGHALFDHHMNGGPMGDGSQWSADHVYATEGVAQDFADYIFETLASATRGSDPDALDHGFDLYAMSARAKWTTAVRGTEAYESGGVLNSEYLLSPMLISQMRQELIAIHGPEKGMQMFQDFIKNGLGRVWMGQSTLQQVTDEYLAGRQASPGQVLDQGSQSATQDSSADPSVSPMTETLTPAAPAKSVIGWLTGFFGMGRRQSAVSGRSRWIDRWVVPFAEESVFRGLMLGLWASADTLSGGILSIGLAAGQAVLFGAAHYRAAKAEAAAKGQRLTFREYLASSRMSAHTRFGLFTGGLVLVGSALGGPVGAAAGWFAAWAVHTAVNVAHTRGAQRADRVVEGLGSSQDRSSVGMSGLARIASWFGFGVRQSVVGQSDKADQDNVGDRSEAGVDPAILTDDQAVSDAITQDGPEATVVAPQAPAAARPWTVRAIDIMGQLLASVKSRLSFSVRHVVIGDLHGDLNALYENLLGAGLIDENWNWTGGDAVIVQIGDYIDRGPDSRAVDEKLRELQKKAREAKPKGGNVIRLMGNHEAMLYQGLKGSSGQLIGWIDNLPEDEFGLRMKKLYEEKGIHAVRKAILTAQSGELADWKAIFDSMQQDIKDGNIQAAYVSGGALFVHAGVTEAYVNGRTAEEVAEALNQDLRSGTFNNGLHDALWNRGDIGTGIPFLQVIGHTPGNEVAVHSTGNVINVDVGNAEYYNGGRGFAEFEGNEARAFNLDLDVRVKTFRSIAERLGRAKKWIGDKSKLKNLQIFLITLLPQIASDVRNGRLSAADAKVLLSRIREMYRESKVKHPSEYADAVQAVREAEAAEAASETGEAARAAADQSTQPQAHAPPAVAPAAAPAPAPQVTPAPAASSSGTSTASSTQPAPAPAPAAPVAPTATQTPAPAPAPAPGGPSAPTNQPPASKPAPSRRPAAPAAQPALTDQERATVDGFMERLRASIAANDGKANQIFNEMLAFLETDQGELRKTGDENLDDALAHMQKIRGKGVPSPSETRAVRASIQADPRRRDTLRAALATPRSVYQIDTAQGPVLVSRSALLSVIGELDAADAEKALRSANETELTEARDQVTQSYQDKDKTDASTVTLSIGGKDVTVLLSAAVEGWKRHDTGRISSGYKRDLKSRPGLDHYAGIKALLAKDPSQPFVDIDGVIYSRAAIESVHEEPLKALARREAIEKETAKSEAVLQDPKSSVVDQAKAKLRIAIYAVERAKLEARYNSRSKGRTAVKNAQAALKETIREVPDLSKSDPFDQIAKDAEKDLETSIMIDDALEGDIKQKGLEALWKEVAKQVPGDPAALKQEFMQDPAAFMAKYPDAAKRSLPDVEISQGNLDATVRDLGKRAVFAAIEQRIRAEHGAIRTPEDKARADRSVRDAQSEFYKDPIGYLVRQDDLKGLVSDSTLQTLEFVVEAHSGTFKPGQSPLMPAIRKIGEFDGMKALGFSPSGTRGEMLAVWRAQEKQLRGFIRRLAGAQHRIEQLKIQSLILQAQGKSDIDARLEIRELERQLTEGTIWYGGRAISWVAIHEAATKDPASLAADVAAMEARNRSESRLTGWARWLDQRADRVKRYQAPKPQAPAGQKLSNRERLALVGAGVRAVVTPVLKPILTTPLGWMARAADGTAKFFGARGVRSISGPTIDQIGIEASDRYIHYRSYEAARSVRLAVRSIDRQQETRRIQMNAQHKLLDDAFKPWQGIFAVQALIDADIIDEDGDIKKEKTPAENKRKMLRFIIKTRLALWGTEDQIKDLFNDELEADSSEITKILEAAESEIGPAEEMIVKVTSELRTGSGGPNELTPIQVWKAKKGEWGVIDQGVNDEIRAALGVTGQNEQEIRASEKKFVDTAETRRILSELFQKKFGSQEKITDPKEVAELMAFVKHATRFVTGFTSGEADTKDQVVQGLKPDQMIMLDLFMMGRSAGLMAGGGKTIVYPLYHVIARRIVGPEYHGMIVAESMDGVRNFTGTKPLNKGGESTLSDLTEVFGMTMVDGSKLQSEHDNGTLIDKLSDPNTIVVIGKTERAHLMNESEKNKGLRDAINLNVVSLVDEVHLLATDRDAALLSSGTDKKMNIEEIQKVKAVIDVVWDKDNGRFKKGQFQVQRFTTEEAYRDAVDRYKDTELGQANMVIFEYGDQVYVSERLRDHLMDQAGLNSRIISSTIRGLIKAGKENTAGGWMQIEIVENGKKRRVIAPIDELGAVKETSVISDLYYQATLAIMATRYDEDLSKAQEMVRVSETSTQIATIDAIHNDSGARVMGATGTSQELEPSIEVILGTPVFNINPSKNELSSFEVVGYEGDSEARIMAAAKSIRDSVEGRKGVSEQRLRRGALVALYDNDEIVRLQEILTGWGIRVNVIGPGVGQTEAESMVKQAGALNRPSEVTLDTEISAELEAVENEFDRNHRGDLKIVASIRQKIDQRDQDGGTTVKDAQLSVDEIEFLRSRGADVGDAALLSKDELDQIETELVGAYEDGKARMKEAKEKLDAFRASSPGIAVTARDLEISQDDMEFLREAGLYDRATVTIFAQRGMTGRDYSPRETKDKFKIGLDLYHLDIGNEHTNELIFSQTTRRNKRQISDGGRYVLWGDGMENNIDHHLKDIVLPGNKRLRGDVLGRLAATRGELTAKLERDQARNDGTTSLSLEELSFLMMAEMLEKGLDITDPQVYRDQVQSDPDLAKMHQFAMNTLAKGRGEDVMLPEMYRIGKTILFMKFMTIKKINEGGRFIVQDAMRNRWMVEPLKKMIRDVDRGENIGWFVKFLLWIPALRKVQGPNGKTEFKLDFGAGKARMIAILEENLRKALDRDGTDANLLLGSTDREDGREYTRGVALNALNDAETTFKALGSAGFIVNLLVKPKKNYLPVIEEARAKIQAGVWGPNNEVKSFTAAKSKAGRDYRALVELTYGVALSMADKTMVSNIGRSNYKVREVMLSNSDHSIQLLSADGSVEPTAVPMGLSVSTQSLAFKVQNHTEAGRRFQPGNTGYAMLVGDTLRIATVDEHGTTWSVVSDPAIVQAVKSLYQNRINEDLDQSAVFAIEIHAGDISKESNQGGVTLTLTHLPAAVSDRTSFADLARITGVSPVVLNAWLQGAGAQGRSKPFLQGSLKEIALQRGVSVDELVAEIGQAMRAYHASKMGQGALDQIKAAVDPNDPNDIHKKFLDDVQRVRDLAPMEERLMAARAALAKKYDAKRDPQMAAKLDLWLMSIFSMIETDLEAAAQASGKPVEFWTEAEWEQFFDSPDHAVEVYLQKFMAQHPTGDHAFFAALLSQGGLDAKTLQNEFEREYPDPNDRAKAWRAFVAVALAMPQADRLALAEAHRSMAVAANAGRPLSPDLENALLESLSIAGQAAAQRTSTGKASFETEVSDSLADLYQGRLAKADREAAQPDQDRKAAAYFKIQQAVKRLKALKSSGKLSSKKSQEVDRSLQGADQRLNALKSELSADRPLQKVITHCADDGDGEACAAAAREFAEEIRTDMLPPFLIEEGDGAAEWLHELALRAGSRGSDDDEQKGLDTYRDARTFRLAARQAGSDTFHRSRSRFEFYFGSAKQSDRQEAFMSGGMSEWMESSRHDSLNEMDQALLVAEAVLVHPSFGAHVAEMVGSLRAPTKEARRRSFQVAANKLTRMVRHLNHRRRSDQRPGLEVVAGLDGQGKVFVHTYRVYEEQKVSLDEYLQKHEALRGEAVSELKSPDGSVKKIKRAFDHFIVRKVDRIDAAVEDHGLNVAVNNGDGTITHIREKTGVWFENESRGLLNGEREDLLRRVRADIRRIRKNPDNPMTELVELRNDGTLQFKDLKKVRQTYRESHEVLRQIVQRAMIPDYRATNREHRKQLLAALDEGVRKALDSADAMRQNLMLSMAPGGRAGLESAPGRFEALPKKDGYRIRPGQSLTVAERRDHLDRWITKLDHHERRHEIDRQTGLKDFWQDVLGLKGAELIEREEVMTHLASIVFAEDDPHDAILQLLTYVSRRTSGHGYTRAAIQDFRLIYQNLPDQQKKRFTRAQRRLLSMDRKDPKHDDQMTEEVMNQMGRVFAQIDASDLREAADRSYRQVLETERQERLDQSVGVDQDKTVRRAHEMHDAIVASGHGTVPAALPKKRNASVQARIQKNEKRLQKAWSQKRAEYIDRRKVEAAAITNPADRAAAEARVAEFERELKRTRFRLRKQAQQASVQGADFDRLVRQHEYELDTLWDETASPVRRTYADLDKGISPESGPTPDLAKEVRGMIDEVDRANGEEIARTDEALKDKDGKIDPDLRRERPKTLKETAVFLPLDAKDTMRFGIDGKERVVGNTPAYSYDTMERVIFFLPEDVRQLDTAAESHLYAHESKHLQTDIHDEKIREGLVELLSILTFYDPDKGPDEQSDQYWRALWSRAAGGDPRYERFLDMAVKHLAPLGKDTLLLAQRTGDISLLGIHSLTSAISAIHSQSGDRAQVVMEGEPISLADLKAQQAKFEDEDSAVFTLTKGKAGKQTVWTMTLIDGRIGGQAMRPEWMRAPVTVEGPEGPVLIDTQNDLDWSVSTRIGDAQLYRIKDPSGLGADPSSPTQYYLTRDVRTGKILGVMGLILSHAGDLDGKAQLTHLYPLVQTPAGIGAAAGGIQPRLTSEEAVRILKGSEPPFAKDVRNESGYLRATAGRVNARVQREAAEKIRVKEITDTTQLNQFYVQRARELVRAELGDQYEAGFPAMGQDLGEDGVHPYAGRVTLWGSGNVVRGAYQGKLTDGVYHLELDLAIRQKPSGEQRFPWLVSGLSTHVVVGPVTGQATRQLALAEELQRVQLEALRRRGRIADALEAAAQFMTAHGLTDLSKGSGHQIIVPSADLAGTLRGGDVSRIALSGDPSVAVALADTVATLTPEQAKAHKDRSMGLSKRGDRPQFYFGDPAAGDPGSIQPISEAQLQQLLGDQLYDLWTMGALRWRAALDEQGNLIKGSGFLIHQPGSGFRALDEAMARKLGAGGFYDRIARPAGIMDKIRWYTGIHVVARSEAGDVAAISPVRDTYLSVRVGDSVKILRTGVERFTIEDATAWTSIPDPAAQPVQEPADQPPAASEQTPAPAAPAVADKQTPSVQGARLAYEIRVEVASGIDEASITRLRADHPGVEFVRSSVSSDPLDPAEAYRSANDEALEAEIAYLERAYEEAKAGRYGRVAAALAVLPDAAPASIDEDLINGRLAAAVKAILPEAAQQSVGPSAADRFAERRLIQSESTVLLLNKYIERSGRGDEPMYFPAGSIYLGGVPGPQAVLDPDLINILSKIGPDKLRAFHLYGSSQEALDQASADLQRYGIRMPAGRMIVTQEDEIAASLAQWQSGHAELAGKPFTLLFRDEHAGGVVKAIRDTEVVSSGTRFIAVPDTLDDGVNPDPLEQFISMLLADSYEETLHAMGDSPDRYSHEELREILIGSKVRWWNFPALISELVDRVVRSLGSVSTAA